jgi:hypothetical protein
MKKHKQIAAKLTIPANKAEWLQLREGVSKKMDQFDKTEEFVGHFDENRAPNVLQRRVGRIELMPLLEGLCAYTYLDKRRDTEEVKSELRFRGLSDEGQWTLGLLASLKKDEADQGSMDKYSFRPLRPGADFREAVEGEFDEEDLSDNDEQEDWA